MKSLINLSALGILLFFFSCNNDPKAEEAKTGEAQTKLSVEGATTFQIDTEASNITWKATKLIGGGHNGSMKISSGSLSAKDGDVVGGSFTIDMNSITNLDLENLEKKADLETHLKSDEFFDTANHPTATFEITKIVPAAENSNGRQTITGNLTIKGITKSITFFAKVLGSGKLINASTGSFVIDRTEWDVKHRSGLIGTAQEQIINDRVAIDITVVARSN